MKNVQVIDGANNATFSLFQATDDEFAAIFVDGCDVELVEDLFDRTGADAANRLLGAIWSRQILNRDALGLHGTLFYDKVSRQIPASRALFDHSASYPQAAK